MKIASPSEMSLMCRLCLMKDKKQVNISIFEDRSDNKLLVKISALLPIKVSKEDQLPKKICNECSNKLNFLYAFRNTALESEQTLLSWFNDDDNLTINPLAETVVKEEVEVDEESLHLDLLQYSPSNKFRKAEEEETEEPLAKRPRQSDAIKSEIHIAPESDENNDEDEPDTVDVEIVANLGYESCENDNNEDIEKLENDFSSSDPEKRAYDQPGPSDLGKSEAEKPCSQLSSSPSLSDEVEEQHVTPSHIGSKKHRMQSQQSTPFLKVSRDTARSSRWSTPSIDSVSEIPATSYQEKVINDLESLKAIQKQHTLILQEILSTVRTKNVQALTRPVDTPNLPIDHKKDFQDFESWLENQTNFTYMRSRVAAVGGSTVRGATMNMMKFLITNEIGMQFNWAGSAPKDERYQQKYPFKDTKMFSLINDAVKLTFAGRETIVNLSDQAVIRAVQDWLKLSKSRYTYNSTK
ncbi:unnamed protein product [Ceutorhynchus assimilis]|uniref:ZAD domain-containing protein n=1 Tax=Ceutorhynchus assimilis TaxID=467358 RepID=A0A9P0DF70_9CUCU|nr:unnamed protein product [Ceutorhynchus assimilis]